MYIQEMTENECLNILTRTKLGRLACAHEHQPYVVPIYFVYEDPYLYGFTTLGQKVEWMRSNPLVCVELDEIVNRTQWMSVVIFGHYEELLDTPESGERWNHHPIPPLQDRPSDVPKHGQERHHAHELLLEHAAWWGPAAASSILRNPEQPLVPVYYRIRIDKITGRRTTPGPDESVTSRRASPAGRSHVWLGRVLHALFKPFARWRGMKRND
jgi:nitroimidazol reductase NimA-like FMN-containing flavoprotein (pyridoxamine 5'-phosphate oxidase superfamily)